MTTRYLGIDFTNMSLDQAAAEAMRRSGDHPFAYVVTPNVDHIVTLYPTQPSSRSDALAQGFSQAALFLCDSRILQRVANIQGIDLSVVAGSDLTATLFRDHFRAGQRIAIIGGNDRTIDRLRDLFPGPDYVQHQPPMGMIGNADARTAVVQFIRDAAPDITLFAFGSPQSELTAAEVVRAGGARGVGLCIGASIDFLTGDQKRAPRWMQRISMEWLYRLVTDPARLWRRYLVEGPRVFRIARKLRRAEQSGSPIQWGMQP